MPLTPRVTPAKQPLRIALSERLAHNPLQAFTLLRAGWQHAHALMTQEQMLAPQIEPDDLRQAEVQTDQLFALLDFVRQCTKSIDRTFFFRRSSSGAFSLKPLGRSLQHVLPAVSALSRPDRRDLAFAPSIETACRAFTHVGLHQLWIDWSQDLQSSAAPLVTLLENFGDHIRDHQRSTSAGRAQALHDEIHRTRFQNTKRYFAKLARAYPTGYLARVELELASGGAADHQTRFLHLHRSSRDLIRRLKLVYGEAMVGDARLIDRASGNGYQAHVALVFDGPSHKELRDIEQALPGLWREVVPNGRLRDANTMPNFQYRGTGAEYRDYESLSSQLGKAAVYMARTGEMFRVHLDGAHTDLVLAEVSDIDPKCKN
ncbi:hypothetical protein EAH83_16245 [Variovorax ginsengisoli]|uniref:Uncharacterized protein n=2 Tax=Variovorax guangxiensis TaxID=1775474 RepID=A0A502DLA9_9BURK|nr:hypothetical protein EAH83_16245 [Variovorax ginsengisoli]TPG26033.1 hypothetical protein EAH82_16730 [Variovorax guangxiensis]